MNMLLTLLTLITIFVIDCTLGKAFDSQRNNKDIFQNDSRGMQREKEMLSSDQLNIYTNPWKSETNDSSTFEQLSVPISNDIPASTISSFLSQLTVLPTSSSLHFHVPTNATSTATGLTSLNDITIDHVSAATATTLRQRFKSPQQKLQQQTRENISSTSTKQLKLNTRHDAQAFCIPSRKRLTMQLKEISCCFLFKMIQQLRYKVFCGGSLPLLQGHEAAAVHPSLISRCTIAFRYTHCVCGICRSLRTSPRAQKSAEWVRLERLI